MRADLFNHVAWRISNDTNVKRVYAWMPMLAWELPKKNVAAKDMVVTLQVDPNHLNMGYPRLSPFSEKARTVIQQMYEDLAKSAYIDGILFHDDVTLSDFEDDSVFAQQQYHQWGLPLTVAKIRMDKVQFQKWTKFKTRFLDELAMQLAQVVRNEQPGLKTARNLYAQVALNNNAQEWYAQSLTESIQYYDYTAIMAMPYMEGVGDQKEFYDAIVKQVKKQHCGIDRTIIELQTVNWKKNNKPIPSPLFNNTIKHLYDLGVHHVAYYPDNWYINNPNADMLKQTFNQKTLHELSLTPTDAQPNE